VAEEWRDASLACGEWLHRRYSSQKCDTAIYQIFVQIINCISTTTGSVLINVLWRHDSSESCVAEWVHGDERAGVCSVVLRVIHLISWNVSFCKPFEIVRRLAYILHSICNHHYKDVHPQVSHTGRNISHTWPPFVKLSWRNQTTSVYPFHATNEIYRLSTLELLIWVVWCLRRLVKIAVSKILIIYYYICY